MPTDEELGRIAWNVPEIDGLPRGPEWDDLDDLQREEYMNIARAVRQALTPAVAPLRPGETVTIPNADGGDPLSFEAMADGEFALIGTSGMEQFFDAAGVARLMETCRRYLAREGRR